MKQSLLHPVQVANPDAPSFASLPANFEPQEQLYLRHFGRVCLRPISQGDETKMIALHEALPEESVYFRFFAHISLDTRTLHERLAKICKNTPESYAIIAQQCSPHISPGRIIAVGRLTVTAEPGVAAFALLFHPEAQNSSFPCDLLKRLVDTARAFGFHQLCGELLVADHDMLNLCRSFGFNLRTIPDEGIVRVSRNL